MRRKVQTYKPLLLTIAIHPFWLVDLIRCVQINQFEMLTEAPSIYYLFIANL